jgi:hypothetical protein
MATPFTTSTGSSSISGTEFSLVNGSTSLAASTTAGELEALIDLSGMIAGDQYQIRVVDKVNGGTATNLWIAFPTGVQSGLFRVPPTRVNEGWDVRVKLITGSARTVAWSLKQDVGDVNALTIANAAIAAATFASGAITSTVIAANAIGASQIATDAIDADSIKTDAVTEIQSGLATSTALSTAQTDLTTLTGRLTSTRAGLLDNLDAAITSRAPSSTAVSNADYTSARATKLDNLDATVSSRAPSSTALTTATWTNTRAGLIDHLDADISSRAPASTAVSNVDYTSARAGKIDNLDAAVTTRAPASTALSTVQWTNARATNLDNLDAAVASRASASAVATVQADTDDIQSRLPAALDGSGNIKAGVQSLVAGALTSIADAIFDTILESAPTNATTFRQRLRVWWSVLSAKATGLAITTAGTEHFRDAADTKDRATYTLATDGTRTPTGFDGT